MQDDHSGGWINALPLRIEMNPLAEIGWCGLNFAEL